MSNYIIAFAAFAMIIITLAWIAIRYAKINGKLEEKNDTKQASIDAQKKIDAIPRPTVDQLNDRLSKGDF